jgi:sec-independent protein translocase protein TatA
MLPTPVFAMFSFNTQTLIILLLAGVLLFGKRLPEMGRMLAKGIREFQNGLKGTGDDDGFSSSFVPEDRPALPRPAAVVNERAPSSVEPQANSMASPIV